MNAGRMRGSRILPQPRANRGPELWDRAQSRADAIAAAPPMAKLRLATPKAYGDAGHSVRDEKGTVESPACARETSRPAAH
jgi:hypothetical protein